MAGGRISDGSFVYRKTNLNIRKGGRRALFWWLINGRNTSLSESWNSLIKLFKSLYTEGRRPPTLHSLTCTWWRPRFPSLFDIMQTPHCPVQCSIICYGLCSNFLSFQGNSTKSPVCHPILFAMVVFWDSSYISLEALQALTSSWKPLGPLDFVLRALRALRPCDPCINDWIVC